MSNPLLDYVGLPPFAQILPEHVEPAIDQILAESRAAIEALLASQPDSWEALVAPLEALGERLDRAWSPVSHLNAVANSEALREAYNACLPKLSDYGTDISQHTGLCAAFKQLAQRSDFGTLTAAQKKIVENALRDFHLAGVDLPQAKRDRYKEIASELSTLTSRFDEHLLDATRAWQKPITDVGTLVGLPEQDLNAAAAAAEREEIEGWLLTLEFPSYYAVVTYADNRELRRELYEAYTTRASDQGPNAGKWDNGPVMTRVLALRQELAQLLGFESYSHYSLATKMADTPERVIGFLDELAEKSLPMARRERAELAAFAQAHCGIDELQAWDVAYVSEKLRQHRFEFSQEEIKPYFPLPSVLDGMFEIARRLFGVTVSAGDGVETWHPSVACFTIRDADGSDRGRFYLDLFARPHKRGGAWMGECLNRHTHGGESQIPAAYVCANFLAPVGDEPALLTHDDVQTLFHEFGHSLHHLLTRIDYPSVAGINGVAWDAVELPSQFMENWCWEREALDLYARHYQSGERLPSELLEKMQAARHFQSGMQMVRQLEFALFDFRMHAVTGEQSVEQIYQLLDEVRAKVSVIKPPAFNRFPHSFSHIFAGGYAAGYYSYKWAEVLSADAFSRFEEQGVFDADTGRDFMRQILEVGGSREAMASFVAFRGREPQIDALLRHNGIIDERSA
jgi:oligopeptidase A